MTTSIPDLSVSEADTGPIDANEGEGSRTAARAYNAGATAFASGFDLSAVDDETLDPEPAMPEADRGPDHTICVHFQDGAWMIEDTSLPRPLSFTHLPDAEAKAGELSKQSGRAVEIRGGDGELLNQYVQH